MALFFLQNEKKLKIITFVSAVFVFVVLHISNEGEEEERRKKRTKQKH